MNIEIGRSRFPDNVGPVLLDAGTEESRVLAILDGTGSWEAGDEEARTVATLLRSMWPANVPVSAEALMRDIESATELIGTLPSDDSFGRPGFSFAAAIVSGDGVSILSCGSYATLHVHDGVVDVLYRPLFWIDEQVSIGTLTQDEARSHRLRHVYSGPLLSRGGTTGCKETGPVRAGRIVIATMELARKLLEIPAALWSRKPADAIQQIEQDGAAHMRPVVIIDIDAG